MEFKKKTFTNSTIEHSFLRVNQKSITTAHTHTHTHTHKHNYSIFIFF